MRRATNDELDAAVRGMAPLCDEQVAQAWDTDPAKPALLRAITGQPAGRRARTRVMVSRRLTVLLAASIALAVLGGAAVASGVFAPDPKDVAAVKDRGVFEEEVHTPGWRPELGAETVLCDWAPANVNRKSSAKKDLEGPPIGTFTMASDGPVDQPLRAADLIKECASGTDAGTFNAKRAKLCVGAQEGGGRSPLPVVLLKARSCERAGYQTADQGRLMADVNHRRAVEIGLLATIKREECIGPRAAERRAKDAVAASGMRLHVTVLDTGEPDEHCWWVVSVAWDRDDVVVSTRYGG